MLPKVVQSLLISAEVTQPLNEVIHGWRYSRRANGLVGPSKFEHHQRYTREIRL